MGIDAPFRREGLSRFHWVDNVVSADLRILESRSMLLAPPAEVRYTACTYLPEQVSA